MGKTRWYTWLLPHRHLTIKKPFGEFCVCRRLVSGVAFAVAFRANGVSTVHYVPLAKMIEILLYQANTLEQVMAIVRRP